MKLFNKLFKKKPSLRERCIEAYGSKFGEIYDNLNSGIPVGTLEETITYLDLIKKVRDNDNKIEIKEID